MMTSLFTSFDPTTIMKTQLNWMSTMIMVFILPLPYWTSPSYINLKLMNINSWNHQEMKSIMNVKYVGSTLMTTSLFMLIVSNNVVGPCCSNNVSDYLMYSLQLDTQLFPYLSFPLWLSFMLFGWLKTTNKKFMHLVPEGTSTSLIPFTVLIETLSNMIRPGVIVLRLMTNMMAGLFLITLLGNSFPNLKSQFMLPMIITQSMQMMFEIMVSCIQAYVFVTLISLYFEE